MRGGVLALVAALLLASPAGAREEGASREEVRRMVVQEALRSDLVPPSLALAVAEAESGFDADAVSPAGARGVMQIMPATARGEFGVAADELWNPRLNIQLGIAFLEHLIDRYDGRWDLALSHYNGGSAVGRGRDARVIPATRAYVDKVLTGERRHARDAAIRALTDSVADAAAGLDRQGRVLALADVAPDRPADRAAAERESRHGDPHREWPPVRHGALDDDRSGSAGLLDRIARRKARFRALLVSG
ncbi:lytic transglycosylase domain-containing protein [Thalassobaculum sp. OXR-137]|uniref:lytic transglycosylase domain-containing protein n=1 Tax=Thalassobaculum sp. OXR-137 TaxID=3100173 RepID=UPI002AC8E34E|nr:lytic transglycosylase domain-containing protein [Thalassobaculum sp. OXR-137]WPZ32196.1 lytic transglycosylase domain-containing protein [Thalassobaculum sp. OXR-137]